MGASVGAGVGGSDSRPCDNSVAAAVCGVPGASVSTRDVTCSVPQGGSMLTSCKRTGRFESDGDALSVLVLGDDLTMVKTSSSTKQSCLAENHIHRYQLLL